MCVQPMKSIAAVALSETWTSGSMTAAGIITGGAVFLLGVTNFIEIVNRIVPGNVVSGLQIGVGIRLASKGIQMVSGLSWVGGYDCILLGIICALLCLFWLREQNGVQIKKRSEDTVVNGEETNVIINTFCKRKNVHPVGIYLFLIGALFAAITLGTTKNENNQYDLPLQFFGAPVAYWAMGEVTANDYWVGFTEGALPQLPLTTLNSVISVCALAHSLYPEKRKRQTGNDGVISRKDVAISVGIMNIVFCPFGSMPNW